ncbi:MAG: TrbI/VirB10 family protein [Pseudomonadota bacterium]|nr:TrbI/VirB10 family protein [Pseudomonadota bacterium]
MEIDKLQERLSNLVLKDALPFTKKRDVNWKIIRNVSIVGVISMVVVILLLPTPRPDQKIFYEKSEGRTSAGSNPANAMTPHENNPTEDTLAQLQSAKSQAGSVPNSLDHLYNSGGGGGGSSANRNSSMVLSRGGFDSKTQLPPGARFSVVLDQSMTLDSHSMPLTATVNKEVTQEDGTAIPQGAKLYGDASFDDASERVQVNWKSVQFPNGTMKPIAGIGVGSDGQVGVEGDVHSNAMKNTVGQTLTRFIGAYAEGSMQRGALGSNPGGGDNGLKNAVAETAKDRANTLAEGMKKERKWIELKAGSIFFVVVTQAFQFRDPGATHGR